MKPRTMLGLTLALTFAASTAAVLAQDNFHVHYRLDNLSQDAHDLSGTLYLNIYNTSGEDAFDLVAWITEPNQVTYDQRHIGVGTLPDGEQVEVVDPFVVPLEITKTEPTDESVTWRLEYTCGLGDRHSVDVAGQKVP